MADYRIDIDRMTELHEKLKKLTQKIAMLTSRVANTEELLSIYKSDALDMQRLILRRTDQHAQNVVEALQFCMLTIDEICEISFSADRNAHNILSDVESKDHTPYRHMDSAIGNCTVVQDYAKIRSILLNELRKVLDKCRKKLDRLSHEIDFSRTHEGSFHPVGSHAAVELAEMSEELSYYVSAIATSTALAVWYDQMPAYSGGSISFNDGKSFFSYQLNTGGSYANWQMNIGFNGYGLTTTWDMGVDTSHGLQQLQEKWNELTKCADNAKDASHISGIHGGWTATPTDVVFTDPRDQYIYDHYYRDRDYRFA